MSTKTPWYVVQTQDGKYVSGNPEPLVYTFVKTRRYAARYFSQTIAKRVAEAVGGKTLITFRKVKP